MLFYKAQMLANNPIEANCCVWGEGFVYMYDSFIRISLKPRSTRWSGVETAFFPGGPLLQFLQAIKNWSKGPPGKTNNASSQVNPQALECLEC